MTSFDEADIEHHVELGAPLPERLAAICWREVKELRAMLESTRQNLAETQARAYELKAKVEQHRDERREARRRAGG